MSSTINAQRQYNYPITVRLYVQECCACGVVFGVPKDLDARFRESHERFFCPNGHGQSYTGPTKAQKQRERAERAEAREQATRDQLDAANAENERIRRSRAAVRGQLTKIRKRGGAGVCPVQGCKRHFANVQRHVASKHPEFLASVE